MAIVGVERTSSLHPGQHIDVASCDAVTADPAAIGARASLVRAYVLQPGEEDTSALAMTDPFRYNR